MPLAGSEQPSCVAHANVGQYAVVSDTFVITGSEGVNARFA